MSGSAIHLDVYMALLAIGSFTCEQLDWETVCPLIILGISAVEDCGLAVFMNFS